jgi:hypothetical protein
MAVTAAADAGSKMSIRRNRTSYIDERATELAASGLYSGWLSIEMAIVAEGYPEARAQLNDPARQQRLDRVCAKAQKAAATSR